MVKCAILNCRSSCRMQRKSEPHISFHSFPKDPEIKDKWITATGNINWFPTKYSKICSLHFDEDSFIGEKQRRWLINTACPTIAVLNVATKTPPSGTGSMENNNTPKKRKIEEIEQDMENYMRYKLVGGKMALKLKKGTLPHKFECQQESKDQPEASGKQRKRKVLNKDDIPIETNTDEESEETNIAEEHEETNIAEEHEETNIAEEHEQILDDDSEDTVSEDPLRLNEDDRCIEVFEGDPDRIYIGYDLLKTNMPRVTRCCSAKHCSNTNRNDPSLSFFQLPNDPERCREWLTRLGRSDLLLLTASKPSSYLICSDHFDVSQTVTKVIKLLKPNALPKDKRPVAKHDRGDTKHKDKRPVAKHDRGDTKHTMVAGTQCDPVTTTSRMHNSSESQVASKNTIVSKTQRSTNVKSSNRKILKVESTGSPEPQMKSMKSTEPLTDPLERHAETQSDPLKSPKREPDSDPECEPEDEPVSRPCNVPQCMPPAHIAARCPPAHIAARCPPAHIAARCPPAHIAARCPRDRRRRPLVPPPIVVKIERLSPPPAAASRPEPRTLSQPVPGPRTGSKSPLIPPGLPLAVSSECMPPVIRKRRRSQTKPEDMRDLKPCAT